MTQRAARILTGRCIDSRVEHDPALRAEVAVVTLEVQRTLKGDHRESVTLRMLNAPHTDNGETATGFSIGEEVVVFLYGESRLGLTSPVGFGQGKFSLHADKTGRKVAVNPLGNANLLRGVSPRSRARLGELARPTKEPLELNRLIAMVEALRN
ncbi:MAG: hypothetical protein GY716_04830 [bacterium]|nr:hypothetical protein [bacterium]